ncbi:MAG: hypothetical protein V3V12_02160 [Gammaproteobacteria bacterium]
MNKTRCKFSLTAILLPSTLILTACGGSGNGTGTGNTGGVPTNYTVTATASVNGSISPSNVTVISGNTASFMVTPNSGFGFDSISGCGGSLLGNTYITANVSTDCVVSVSFKPLTPSAGAASWKTSQLLETNNAGDARSPTISIGPSGIALAVWYQYDGTRDNIWANRYTPADGWGTAELIETSDVRYAFNTQIAIDASGNALAIWQQGDTVEKMNIWTNRYTLAGGWGIAQLIETDDIGTASSPQIAVDSSGNALAIWGQSDGAKLYSIWANHFTPSGGWGAAELVEDSNENAAFPQITIDSLGNALAVWQQGAGISKYNIWANRFTLANGWGAAELIEANGGSAGFPQITIDPVGNALAIWMEFNSSGQNNIWVNRYTPVGGWASSELIENGSGSADFPQITVDPSGNAIAVWQQSDGTRINIWARRYTLVDGWGTAELIETDDAGDARFAQIAIDPSGNGLVAWMQSGFIWANRFTQSGGWGVAEPIEAGNAWHEIRSPQIAIDSSGNALAVWHHFDGTRTNIWANRFE